MTQGWASNLSGNKHTGHLHKKRSKSAVACSFSSVILKFVVGQKGGQVALGEGVGLLNSPQHDLTVDRAVKEDFVNHKFPLSFTTLRYFVTKC